MVVGVDEARQQRQTAKVQLIGVGRHGYRAARPHPGDAGAVQQHHRILHYRPAGAVNQPGAAQCLHTLSRRFPPAQSSFDG